MTESTPVRNTDPTKDERTMAIDSLHQSLTEITSTAFEADQPADGQFITRYDGHYGDVDVALSEVVPTDSQQEPAELQTTLELADRTNCRQTSPEDSLVEEMYGGKVLGSVMDHQPSDYSAGVLERHARYVIVRRGSRLDVFRLPPTLVGNDKVKQGLMATAYRRRNPQDGEPPYESWISDPTLDLMLDEAFADHIQPAPTEEIRALATKVQRVVANLPAQKAEYEQSLAAREETSAPTLRQRLGKLACGLIS